jgi:hypothetical protein
MLGVPARALRRDTQPGVLASAAGMAKGAARVTAGQAAARALSGRLAHGEYAPCRSPPGTARPATPRASYSEPAPVPLVTAPGMSVLLPNISMNPNLARPLGTGFRAPP